jgi:hypothetical protein
MSPLTVIRALPPLLRNYKQEIISSDEYICSVNIIVAEISFYRDKKLL